MEQNNTKKYWFSSDWHLQHKNIIKYDNRPFKTIEEHDEIIISNFEKVVNKGDDFYFLGDFSFTNDSKLLHNWFERLANKANLFFISGNHDHHKVIPFYNSYGKYLRGLAEINVNNQDITLCHYAMKVWNKSHKGAWHLYGHSHHSLKDDPNSLSIDVGINGKNYNYLPLEFKQIQDIMSKKNYKPLDHHK